MCGTLTRWLSNLGIPTVFGPSEPEETGHGSQRYTPSCPHNPSHTLMATKEGYSCLVCLIPLDLYPPEDT